MALRMSSEAGDGSAISPLRTPRERAWPKPMMLRAPDGFTSPTTAQTLEVPISSPTMIEDASNISFLVVGGFEDLLSLRRNEVRFLPASRQIVRHRQIDRNQRLPHRYSVIH